MRRARKEIKTTLFTCTVLNHTPSQLAQMNGHSELARLIIRWAHLFGPTKIPATQLLAMADAPNQQAPAPA